MSGPRTSATPQGHVLQERRQILDLGLRTVQEERRGRAEHHQSLGPEAQGLLRVQEVEEDHAT